MAVRPPRTEVRAGLSAVRAAETGGGARAPRRRGRPAGRLAAVFALALLGACAGPAPVPEAPGDPVTRAIAPYEGLPWPRPLARLGLPEDRDYVALLHVPPLNPIDLSEEERTRVTLETAIFDPVAIAAGKTSIGHLMVGWQCGGVRGLTSKTGESSNQGLQMAAKGWGVAAILSTFTDGRLLGQTEASWRHLTMLDRGRGSILVAEVTPQDCARLRARLADYVTHPAEPARRFGLLLDPDRFEGDGCLSFGMWLAAQGGVLAEARPAFHREVTVREGIVGRRVATLPTVEPYIAPGLPPGETVVTLAALRRGPWNAGRVLDQVRMVDGELILAAVTALRPRAGARPDWRTRRAMPAGDPGVARAVAAAAAWAARYPVARIADPAGASALVLEFR